MCSDIKKQPVVSYDDGFALALLNITDESSVMMDCSAQKLSFTAKALKKKTNVFPCWLTNFISILL